jgi:hypothetical protein
MATEAKPPSSKNSSNGIFELIRKLKSKRNKG